MKRGIFFTVFVLIALLTVSVFPAVAQSNGDITSFSTTATTVGRSALVNRSARIPVSWTTVNRPLTANLIFEQVLPDGNLINVELPRVIPFVASSGDGIAAPILPDGDVTSITLRVTLRNMFNNAVYDSAEIVIPIVNGTDGGNGGGNVQAIIDFNVSYSAPINRTELANGTVRLPVSWTAINRRTFANLIFEQLLPDGSVVNVELPRDFQWVNSSDSGVVAPVAVGDNASHIVLRVRLADISYDRTYDQRYAYVPLQSTDNDTEITEFSSTTTSITQSAVNGAWIDVSWSVSNRPDGTNLVFEQILPDGNVRNAELPRDVLIVPSIGSGIVVPILPSQDTDELVFRLRVVDLSNNGTIASAQLSIDIVDSTVGEYRIVTGNACYQAPFPANQGITVGEQGRTQYRYNGTDVEVFSSSDINNRAVIATVSAGDAFTIEDGPHCSYYTLDDGFSYRQWYINVDGQQGWIEEYNARYDDEFIYNFVAADRDDYPVVRIDNFTITPDSISSEELESTTFTITWETSNAETVSLSYEETFHFDLPGDGSMTVDGADLVQVSGIIGFSLNAHGVLSNTDSAGTSVAVDTSATITSFTVSPESTSGNSQVTLTWDIEGDFESAGIYILAESQVYTEINIYEIESNSGSTTYTLPDDRVGNFPFALRMIDNSGAEITGGVSVDVSCAYTWGFSISEEDCPESELISRTGAYQTFQRGYMIWLPNDSESLWVFYHDGTYARYQDSWDNSDYTIDGNPPEGTFAPERGFGYLWNTVPAVRSGLGWATGSEQSYTVNFQANLLDFGGYNGRRFYIQRPDGQVIRAYGFNNLNPDTWEIAN